MVKILGVIAIGIAVYLAIAYFRRLARTTETENRTDIDNWVDESLSNALGQKLYAPAETILQTLRGAAEPGLVASINEKVQSVTVSFTRGSSHRDVEVLLDVEYADGSAFSVNTQRNWDQLPETIREEILRTSKDTTRRQWFFPWASSN